MIWDHQYRAYWMRIMTHPPILAPLCPIQQLKWHSKLNNHNMNAMLWIQCSDYRWSGLNVKDDSSMRQFFVPWISHILTDDVSARGPDRTYLLSLGGSQRNTGIRSSKYVLLPLSYLFFATCPNFFLFRSHTLLLHLLRKRETFQKAKLVSNAITALKLYKVLWSLVIVTI